MVAALKRHEPSSEFHGVGGPLMEAAGLKSIFPYKELSVVGIAEVIPKLPGLLKRIRETAAAVLTDPPDAVITIDSPDFCLRVAGRIKSARKEIPIIHYVSPTVWAWRAGRTKQLSASVDRVLALFPFEADYLLDAGINCKFVGHPIVDEQQASCEQARQLRTNLGIGQEEPTVLVLPGSRASEVRRLAPRFAKALALLLQRIPALRTAVYAADDVVDLLEEIVPNWQGNAFLLSSRDKSIANALMTKKSLFKSANFALAASGTVSLELAAAGTPMVIAYDMNWLSRTMIARMLTVETVTLVNLITGTKAVPELLGARCRPDLICDAVEQLAVSQSQQAAQRAAFDEAMKLLGRNAENPAHRAARAVLEVLK